jgi:hypothetical protein
MHYSVTFLKHVSFQILTLVFKILKYSLKTRCENVKEYSVNLAQIHLLLFQTVRSSGNFSVI